MYFALEFASQIKCRERLKQSQCIFAPPFVHSLKVTNTRSFFFYRRRFVQGRKEEVSDLDRKNGNDGMEATDERLQNR